MAECHLLFPTLEDEPFCEIDLPREAERWIARQRKNGKLPNDGSNPLLDWARFQEFRDDFHRSVDATWSYGGYGEDRSSILHGTYLAMREKYIHLGVDCFVDAHTPVALCSKAKILDIYHEEDSDIGWGSRVIVELLEEETAPEHIRLIMGHLKRRLPRNIRRNRILPAGTIIAEVGEIHENGNVAPHLHLQTLLRTAFERLLREGKLASGESALDGYCTKKDAHTMLETCPNPLQYVTLSRKTV